MEQQQDKQGRTGVRAIAACRTVYFHMYISCHCSRSCNSEACSGGLRYRTADPHLGVTPLQVSSGLGPLLKGASRTVAAAGRLAKAAATAAAAATVDRLAEGVAAVLLRRAAAKAECSGGRCGSTALVQLQQETTVCFIKLS